MSNSDEDQTVSLPPHAQLIRMSADYLRSRVLFAAANLNLADHLAEGPKNVQAIADKTGTHEPSLYRLMRALTHWDIVSMEGDRRFSLTPLGEALKTDAPGAARSTILAVAGDGFWNSFHKLPETLKDGEPGMKKAFGVSFFDYFDERPEQASHFNDAMIGFHGAEPPAVAAAYDFSAFDTIVDVGGGTGNMLTTILEQCPEPEGVLFDLPRVIREAPEFIETRGLSDRITCESGSFFQEIPEGGSVYILSHIIHDWPRDECLKILRNCRAVMPSESKLLIVEMVLPDEGPPHPGYELDMVMLALTGGKERTEEEYVALLEETDFQKERVIPTDSPVSIVEAVPA